MRVGYNDTHKILQNTPCFMSFNEGLVAAEIPTFQALNLQKCLRICAKMLEVSQ